MSQINPVMLATIAMSFMGLVALWCTPSLLRSLATIFLARAMAIDAYKAKYAEMRAMAPALVHKSPGNTQKLYNAV